MMTTRYTRPIETSSTTTALPPKPHSPPTSHKFSSIHSTFALSTCELVLRHHRHSTPPNHSLDYFYHSTLPTPHIHFTNSTHPLHHSPIHPHSIIPPPTTPPYHHTNQHYHTTIPPHQPTLLQHPHHFRHGGWVCAHPPLDHHAVHGAGVPGWVWQGYFFFSLRQRPTHALTCQGWL